MVLKDRQHIGTMADQRHYYIIIEDQQMDIISFLKKYQIIYSNPITIQNIIKFVKNSLLLKRTYRKENRRKIFQILETLSTKTTREIVRLIKQGYLYVIPEHHQYLVMFFWGWKTFDEMVETDILRQAQSVYTTDGIKKINVPREMIPASFVLSLAQLLGIDKNLCNKSLMRRCGFHHLSIMLGALNCFYSLSDTRIEHIFPNLSKFFKIFQNFLLIIFNFVNKFYSEYIIISVIDYWMNVEIINQFFLVINGRGIGPEKSKPAMQ